MLWGKLGETRKRGYKARKSYEKPRKNIRNSRKKSFKARKYYVNQFNDIQHDKVNLNKQQSR